MKWLIYKMQLRKEATDATEAAELAALARQISRLKVPALSAEAKARIAREIGFTPRRSLHPWVLGLGTMAAILLIAVVALAQYARPGSPLYSVKHESDRLQQFIHTETSQPTVPNSDNKGGISPAVQPQSDINEHHSATATPTPKVESGDDKGGATPAPVPATSGGSSSSSGGGSTDGGGSTPSGGGHGGTSGDDTLSISGH